MIKIFFRILFFIEKVLFLVTTEGRIKKPKKFKISFFLKTSCSGIFLKK